LISVRCWSEQDSAIAHLWRKDFKTLLQQVIKQGLKSMTGEKVCRFHAVAAVGDTRSTLGTKDDEYKQQRLPD